MEYTEEIIKVLQQIASGNFKARVNIRQDHEEFDAIAVGINMLAEEISVLITILVNDERELMLKLKDLEDYKSTNFNDFKKFPAPIY